MTVSELTPIELYAIIMMALLTAKLGSLAARESANAHDWRERLMFAAGLFAIFGLPFIIAMRALEV